MKKHFLPLIIFIGISIVFTAALYSHKTRPIVNLAGKSIVHLEFTDVNSGELVRLPGQSIIHVFSTWCETCKTDLLSLQKLKQQYNIKIIGLLFNDSLNNVLDLQKQVDDVYNMVVKPNDEAVIKLVILGTPETLLLDKNGNIAFNHKGELNEEVINVLHAKLNEKQFSQLQ